MTQDRSNHFKKGEDLRVAGFSLKESAAAAVAERRSMMVLMIEESRLQIAFEKLAEVRPEQWEPAQSEAEVQALRRASDEIAKLARELLEITDPPASLFTTT